MKREAAKKTKAKGFKDSGKRQAFSTGAVRDIQAGKGRFDLIPPLALQLVACVFETGAAKYGPSNWRKGIPIGRFLDSGQRHLQKYIAGMRDEAHLSMALWNLLCALHTAAGVELGKYPAELYDLPNDFPGERPSALSEYEKERLWRVQA
jgi:hypothetical protein